MKPWQIVMRATAALVLLLAVFIEVLAVLAIPVNTDGGIVFGLVGLVVAMFAMSIYEESRIKEVMPIYKDSVLDAALHTLFHGEPHECLEWLKTTGVNLTTASDIVCVGQTLEFLSIPEYLATFEEKLEGERIYLDAILDGDMKPVYNAQPWECYEWLQKYGKLVKDDWQVCVGRTLRLISIPEYKATF